MTQLIYKKSSNQEDLEKNLWKTLSDYLNDKQEDTHCAEHSELDPDNK